MSVGPRAASQLPEPGWPERTHMATTPGNRIQLTVPARLVGAQPGAAAAFASVPILAWFILGTSGVLDLSVFAAWVATGVSALAATLAFAAAAHSAGRARPAWYTIAAAAALLGLGTSVAAFAPEGLNFSRTSNFAVLAGLLLATAGTTLLAQPAGECPGVRVLTGAAATALGITALLWEPALSRITTPPGGGAFDLFLTEALVASSLAIVFTVFLTLQDRAERSAETLLIFLSLGIGTIAAAGVAVIPAHSGDGPLHGPPIFPLFLAAGLSLVGLAAARHLDGSRDYTLNRDHRRPTSLVRQAVPIGAAMAALGLGALHPAAFGHGFLPVLLLGAVTLALAHEAMVLFDQMQLNNLLRSSEAALQRRHTLVVDSSPDLISVLDLDGLFEYANHAHAWLLGHDPKSLVGTPILQIVDRRDAPAMLAFVTQARSNALSKGPTMMRFKSVDGRSRPFEAAAHALRDASGKPGSVVIVSRDVAERRAAERRWRSSEARKGALFASAPDAILSVDLDGSVSECNPAAEELFDLDDVDLAALTFDDVMSSFGDEEGAPFENLSGKLTWGRESVHSVECTGRRSGGSEFPAEVSVSRVEGVGSEGFIVFVRDISERMRVETQLRDSQKLEAIGRLAGGVAHDFNNLLTVIHGYAEFAKAETPASGQLNDDVDEIIKASDRARDLTRQLLAFARRQVVEPRNVDPNELVAGMQKMLGRLVSEDITIRTDLDPDLYPTHIDPGQFEQVLVNLVVNASDAMPRGGTVSIMTENIEATEAATLAPQLPEADYVVISVADTGSGMSPETQAQIFEPFFSTKGPAAGVGLGLATCYGIAKQSGGEITVESEPGRGSVFRVWLCRAVEPAGEAVPEVPRELQGGYETILFVEDERGIRTLTERYLRSLGYRVIVAEDGAEALSLLQTTHEPIHLLISDVVMPKMSGLDLADRILARSPATHILFISGYPRDVLAERGVMPREVSLLPKPFTFESLALRVREALDPARPQTVDGEPGEEIVDPVARELDRRMRGRHTA